MEQKKEESLNGKQGGNKAAGLVFWRSCWMKEPLLGCTYFGKSIDVVIAFDS